jgi:hypothetical protein
MAHLCIFIIFLGSSTACVLILNRETSTVYTANIGDSGFIVVRKVGIFIHNYLIELKYLFFFSGRNCSSLRRATALLQHTISIELTTARKCKSSAQ